MTVKEAIKLLKYNSNVIHKTINGKTDPNEVEALDMAIKALEQEQDVHDTCKKCVEFSEFEQQPRWIPVSERLPEIKQHVLLSCYGRVIYGRMISEDGNSGYPVLRYATAWVRKDRLYLKLQCIVNLLQAE